MSTRSEPFASIANVGTPNRFPSSPDDDQISVSLPFAFDLFGQTYRQGDPLSVSTNGTISFTGAFEGYDNSASPQPGLGLIAGFWDDLDVPQQTVYVATTGSMGSRVFVVEWDHATIHNRPSSTIRFQIRLFESSRVIEVHFGPSSSVDGDASVGVHDPAITSSLFTTCSPSCSFGDFPSGTVVAFTPSAGPPPPMPDLTCASMDPMPSSMSPGQRTTLNFVVRNNGSQASIASEIAVVLAATPDVSQQQGIMIGRASVPFVPAGASQGGSMDVTIPANLSQGTYWSAAFADANSQVSEADENNNRAMMNSFVVGGAPLGSITITTRALPGARVGIGYSHQLTQTGAPNPRWQVIAGPTGGNGLTLAPNGLLSGRPLLGGNFSYRVEASESGYTPGTADLVLNVNDQTGPALVNREIPAAIVGAPYNAQLEATGGTAPYALQIVGGKPAWLTMDSQGRMSGTPSETGEYSLSISIFDSTGASGSDSVTLTAIEARPLEFDSSQTSLPAAVQDLEYAAQLRARGGAPPYRFSIASGSLPAGIELRENGTLVGRSSAVGESRFTARVSDALSATAEKNFALTVEERRALEETVPDRISLTFDVDANFELTARGGVAPYSWTLATGSLPAGITLNDGFLRGRPTSSTAPGRDVVFRVRDTAGETKEAATVVAVTKGTRSGGVGGSLTRDSGCGCRGANAASKHHLGASLAGALVIVVVSLWSSHRRRSVMTMRRQHVPPS